MIELKYFIQDTEDRAEAIRAVKTLAAAYNLEITIPPAQTDPGDIPG